MRRDAVRAAAEARGRVRLRVEVDEQAALAGLGEAGGEVDGGRRLADAALLVRDRVDASGHPSQASRARRTRSRFVPASSATSSGERALLRNAGPAREARRRRAGLADREQARRRRLERAAEQLARRSATRSGSADSPTQSTTRPPSSTSGRHHSAAVGGCASAFATATPNRPGSCSSARPQTTERFGSSAAQVSRKRHLRRSASSSVTARSGSATASGIPGVPPPEPTSTIGAVGRRRRAPRPAARRRAAPARAVAGIADRRQPRRRENRREPAVEDASAARGAAQSAERRGRTTTNRVGSVPSLDVSTSGSSFSSSCTIRRSTAVIGSSSTRWPVAAACSAARRATRLERGRAARAIAGSVDDDAQPVVAVRAVPDRVGEVLERVDRLAVAADQHAEVGADERRDELARRSRRSAPSPARRSRRSSARAARARAPAWLVSSSCGSAGGARRSGRRPSRHRRRRVADAEQARARPR